MYLVWDTECDGDEINGRICNQFIPGHKVIVSSMKIPKNDPQIITNEVSYERGLTASVIVDKFNLSTVKVLVGQNVKFDLLWIWGNANFQAWLAQGGLLWDTQTVEYLLTAQETKFASLNELSFKYGGTIKNDEIGKLLKSGLKFSEIPKDAGLKYAAEDVLNTEKVFLAQYKKAKDLNMLGIIRAYMLHYQAVCEIEFNGIYFAKHRCLNLANEYTEALSLKLDEIQTLAYNAQLWEDKTFNPASPKQIQEALFSTIDTEGLAITTKGALSTNKEALEKFSISGTGPAYNLAKLILEYRTIAKLLNTYLLSEDLSTKKKKKTGYYAYLNGYDQCIHSEFQTALTNTGRLSSTKPNIQNAPKKSAIRSLFTSRFGDRGCMVALDYGGLEVVLQAYVTQSKQFIKDIQDGIDFHVKRLSYIVPNSYDELVELCKTDPYWKGQRQIAKIVSYQKAYGAQIKKLSKTSGLEESILERLFEQEDINYPEIRIYYDKLINEIKNKSAPTKNLLDVVDKSKNTILQYEGEYQFKSIIQSVTGKLYAFYDNAVLTQRKQIFRYFKLPQIQNYPIQGLAADLVGLMTGRVFQFLSQHRDKALLVNEVHDEIVLDCLIEHKDFIITNVKRIMEDVDTAFQQYFHISFNVPLAIENGFGQSWADCK